MTNSAQTCIMQKNKIKMNKKIIDHYRSLMTHIGYSLDNSIRESFDNTIHLFVTKNDVHNHNKCCSKSLDQPISHSVVIGARNNNSD
jgi:hypothetical protein